MVDNKISLYRDYRLNHYRYNESLLYSFTPHFRDLTLPRFALKQDTMKWHTLPTCIGVVPKSKEIETL